MPSQAMAKLVSRYPPEVQSLALSASKFLLLALPRAQETVDETASVVLLARAAWRERNEGRLAAHPPRSAHTGASKRSASSARSQRCAC
jgi:hypothetical protein